MDGIDCSLYVPVLCYSACYGYNGLLDYTMPLPRSESLWPSLNIWSLMRQRGLQSVYAASLRGSDTVSVQSLIGLSPRMTDQSVPGLL